MKRDITQSERRAAVVAVLRGELAWKLDMDRQHAYVAAMLPYLPEQCADADLRRIVLNYHQDHALVGALLDRANPRYEQVWIEAIGQVVRMALHQGHAPASGAMVDGDDLAQVALEALIRALPSFHYASRFSTWAYAVVGRSIQRYLRDLHASKRHRQVESLELYHELNDIPAADVQPEAHSEASALAALIEHVLAEHTDARLAYIFQLSTRDELRLAQIGQLVHLSPSRVSIVLAQARELLRQSPELRAWLGEDRATQARSEWAAD